MGITNKRRLGRKRSSFWSLDSFLKCGFKASANVDSRLGALDVDDTHSTCSFCSAIQPANEPEVDKPSSPLPNPPRDLAKEPGLALSDYTISESNDSDALDLIFPSRTASHTTTSNNCFEDCFTSSWETSSDILPMSTSYDDETCWMTSSWQDQIPCSFSPTSPGHIIPTDQSRELTSMHSCTFGSLGGSSSRSLKGGTYKNIQDSAKDIGYGKHSVAGGNGQSGKRLVQFSGKIPGLKGFMRMKSNPSVSGRDERMVVHGSGMIQVDGEGRLRHKKAVSFTSEAMSDMDTPSNSGKFQQGGTLENNASAANVLLGGGQSLGCSEKLAVPPESVYFWDGKESVGFGDEDCLRGEGRFNGRVGGRVNRHTFGNSLDSFTSLGHGSGSSSWGKCRAKLKGFKAYVTKALMPRSQSYRTNGEKSGPVEYDANAHGFGGDGMSCVSGTNRRNAARAAMYKRRQRVLVERIENALQSDFASRGGQHDPMSDTGCAQS